MSNPYASLTPAEMAILAPQSRVGSVIAGTVAPFVIGTIFVFARFYTRTLITRNWGWDDSLVLIAWILAVGVTATNLAFVKYGVGRHGFLQTMPDVIHTLQLAFVTRILYILCITVIKVGIGAFYLRIFRDRVSRIWIWIINGLIGAGGFALFLTVLLQISPIRANWSLAQIGVKHYSDTAGVIFTAVINIAGDVGLMVFILPRIWPLKMPTKQKITLLCVVSLGVLVIVATIVRLQKGLTLNHSTDVPWDSYDLTTWSAVEINIGLFCSSAPTIRPLIRQLMPGAMKSQSGGTNYATQSRKYGGGTVKSRAREQGFELHSQTDIDLPVQGAKAFWGKTKQLSDSDSENGVLQTGKGNNGEILKTVSVMITDRSREGNDDVSTTGSTKRFEHV